MPAFPSSSALDVLTLGLASTVAVEKSASSALLSFTGAWGGMAVVAGAGPVGGPLGNPATAGGADEITGVGDFASEGGADFGGPLGTLAGGGLEVAGGADTAFLRPPAPGGLAPGGAFDGVLTGSSSSSHPPSLLSSPSLLFAACLGG